MELKVLTKGYFLGLFYAQLYLYSRERKVILLKNEVHIIKGKYIYIIFLICSLNIIYFGPVALNSTVDYGH